VLRINSAGIRGSERRADHRRDAAAVAERRLDNVVYRLGSRRRAPGAAARAPRTLRERQEGGHPVVSVREGDVVTVLGRTQKNPTIEHAMEEVKGRGIPEWLSFDSNTITGRINAMPTREQINLPVQEQLIVELYSK
jgi:small subunit ribosomal protein S4